MTSRGKLVWKLETAEKNQGAPGKLEVQDDEVSAKFRKMNLVAGENERIYMSDDDEEEDHKIFSIIGKVLSPKSLHLQTIMGAMKPAWGNSRGLRARMVGDNVFIADFMNEMDKERALVGSPWLVGRHAVLLKEFEKNLRLSDVRFESMHIWVRIIDLNFKWMNKKKCWKIVGLVGKVNKLDVDEFGNAARPFLRARVEIPIDKPLKRFITIETKDRDEFYDLQYEKLPFFCFSCGIMGHSELDCPKPSERDADGKWEYDNRIRALGEKKKRVLSFAQAAAAVWDGAPNRSESHSSSKTRSSEEFSSHKSERGKAMVDEAHTSFSQKRDTSQDFTIFEAQDVNQNLNNVAATRKRNNTILQHFDFINERNRLLENTGNLALVPIDDKGEMIGESSTLALVELDQRDLEGAKKQKMELSQFARLAEAAGEQPRRAQ
jgi:hypothetical protein